MSIKSATGKEIAIFFVKVITDPTPYFASQERAFLSRFNPALSASLAKTISKSNRNIQKVRLYAEPPAPGPRGRARRKDWNGAYYFRETCTQARKYLDLFRRQIALR